VAQLIARLVAKGYAHIYSVDYSNMFSLVAKLASVHLFISLAATNDWLGPFINSMSIMLFFMVTYRRKFIWSNHLGLLLRRS